MKMTVKLAVLFATLLLLTGVVYAGFDCGVCYEVTATDLDDPTNVETGCILVNFCNGELLSPFGTDMVLFFDSMKDQALGYDDQDPSCVGYFKFHGDDLHVLKGIGYCEGERHNIKGSSVDCCSTSGCPCL